MKKVTITKTKTRTIESGPQAQTITVSDEAPAVQQQQPLPSVTAICTTGAVVAVCAWACVQIIKTGWKSYISQHKIKRPWWYSSTLRVLAVAIGAALGTALYGSLTGVSGGWPWGTLVGFGAGSLSAIIVAVVKSKLKKAADA